MEDKMNGIRTSAGEARHSYSNLVAKFGRKRPNYRSSTYI